MENIKIVDEIVNRTEHLFSQFYGDDETAFVFTADHGMSKIGNHGDGGKSESRHTQTRSSPKPSDVPVPQTPTTLGLPLSPGAKVSEAHSPISANLLTMNTPSHGI
jgi:hypothetical protein